MADEAAKLPLRRLEPPIHKFIKVAIPTDLERLQKHQANIEKYQRCQQWDRLHQEHINASRTVQQLRANVREMEKLCGRVRSEDARALERLGPARDPAEPRRSPAAPDELSGAGEGEEQLLAQAHIPLPEIPQDQSAAESWGSLEEDLLDLDGLVNEFSQLVHSQQAKIDSIEDNVEAAAANGGGIPQPGEGG
ncbi:hypothetical protein ANANG_G00014010 [Anguilla anguilla]|uniref:STX17-like N-terminal domain-containing protein n=1 Tax=Anguilla anguilla TaxID=7936 RepID=A0A9D3MXR7_ANGAN|nr:hypothetical protein ANANG_G00014010 [Anguilla anguilla]